MLSCTRSRITSIEEFVDLTYSKITENEYDALNRLIARYETDPEVDNVLFQTGEYHYDEAGRQVSTTDALGRTTTSQYDALDRLTSQTLPDVFGHVMDRGSTGYAETGTWTAQAESDAYNGSQRYHAAGTSTNTASWTYSGLVIGRTYDIYVTYAADAINAATDSPYTVTHSGDSDTFDVDQQVAPDDYTSHGQAWHYLTSITIEDASDLVIELSDDVASGRVLADAVGLVDVDPTITKTYDKVIDASVGVAERLDDIEERWHLETLGGSLVLLIYVSVGVLLAPELPRYLAIDVFQHVIPTDTLEEWVPGIWRYEGHSVTNSPNGDDGAFKSCCMGSDF
ncbi:MAG: hypothetical protein K8T91_24930 [Planctomycetes bacterium]|nr:hypothetical protein [Planctomycetota bacterium]